MRYYSSTAGAMALTADITAGATTLNVSSTAGLPVSFPYTLVLDVGQSTEEIVTVTAANGSLLTVSRGQDGSSAQSHSLGAVVRHMMTARDLREPQDHIAASAGVHGVTGSVVGTSDTQTLTNKTLGATAFTGAITGGQAATLGAVTASGVTSSGAITANTGAAVTGLTVNGNAAPTAPAVNLISDKVLGTDDYIKLGPGLANVFEYGQGNYNLTLPAALTVGKSGQVSIVGSQGLGEPTTATLSVRGSLGGAGGTTESPLLSLRKSDNTEVLGVDSTGAITSPTVTSLSGRIGAVETNLGSQTTFVASSAAKDGKRIHWETKTAGPTDANGYFTVTHNAGFTPTSVLASNSDGYQMGIDSYTATTFRMRLLTAAGAVFNGASTTLTYMCGE